MLFGFTTIQATKRTYDGTPDNLGIVQPTETQFTINNCSFQPQHTEELQSNADAVNVYWKLYAPAGTDLTSVDYITVNGEKFEVDGDPMPWTDFFGFPHHVELMFRKATG